MLYEDISFGRRLRGQILREAGHTFRAHPLLAIAFLLVAATALATAVAILFVVLVSVAFVAAVGFVGYMAARELLRIDTTPADERRLPRRAVERAGAERYLFAVDEFADLAQFALSAGLDSRPREQRLRRALRDARRLRETAHDLARNWRGPASIAACMVELEAAAVALMSYLAELSRGEWERASQAALRWQRDDLSQRRDALMRHLQEVDFRHATGAR
jgi:hypothetical protein